MEWANEGQESFYSTSKGLGGDAQSDCKPAKEAGHGGHEENHVQRVSVIPKGLRSKLNHQVRRWRLGCGEGVRRYQGNDVIVMVFKVQRFLWIDKYITFYRVHVTYFLTLGCLGTLVMYVLPLANSKRLSFVDAIYTSFSAVCGTGLQTVRSPDLTQIHNFVIIVLLNLGAPVLVSLLPLYARRFYFHLCIKQFDQDLCTELPTADHSTASSPANYKDLKLNMKYDHRESKHVDTDFDPECSPDDLFVGMERDVTHGDKMGDLEYHVRNTGKEDSWEKWRMLVDAKQALRTLEYRALVSLSWLVIGFFFGSQVTGFILGAIYFLGSPHDSAIVREKDINPTFYAFSTAVSTFTNGGYNVNNDSMLAFQKSSFLLMLYTILAALGNTMYAPTLRLLVWIHYRLVGENDKVVYEYLLRHPRRCFTNLFPRAQTIWLVAIFAGLTGLQLILLYALEWNEALGGMNMLEKLFAGVYQTVGTRNAGGNVVKLNQLAPAVLFLFLVMMYISAYPMFLSVQTSNDEYDDTELVVSNKMNYKENLHPEHWESILVAQSRRLLARDTSYLFFAILFLCLSENRGIKKDPLNFSIFNIVFEVISAYGSIGLSLGYNCDLQIDKTLPCENVPYSFSGNWTSAGKLILVIVMFLGRHRGLPDNIDSAIRLPTKLLAPNFQQTPQSFTVVYTCKLTTLAHNPCRRCEEYVKEVELRMRPQLQLAQNVSPDFMRQWIAVQMPQS